MSETDEDLMRCQGPRHTFTIKGYRFAWAAGAGWRRWECSKDGLGTGMSPTPWHAWRSLRRWQREMRDHPERYRL